MHPSETFEAKHYPLSHAKWIALEAAGIAVTSAERQVKAVQGRLYNKTAKGQAAKERDLAEAYAELDRARRQLAEAEAMPEDKPKRGPGRPRVGEEPTITVGLRLDPERAAWLKAQPGGASAWLRERIDRARQAVE